MSKLAIDVVVLSRDAGPLRGPVLAGLQLQREVLWRLHRVIGAPQAADRNRWETISRARNEGRLKGHFPWLMFVDDDVVLAPGTVARLLRFLTANPIYGAAAADYHDQRAGTDTMHVAMGATLFRREVLQRIQFRWENGRCECRCCCEDLRRMGYGIRYVPGVTALHLTEETPNPRHSGEANAAEHRSADQTGRIEGHVLVAFDRRHLNKFRRQFLGSLRSCGNHDQIHVVGYGLYPSEANSLASLPGVQVDRLVDNRVMPPIRRLRDFQPVVARLPENAPVAYWDAADVFFQGSLQPLWQIVGRHPQRLLAAREPSGYPSNPAVRAWSLTITDRHHRENSFRLLQKYPFLNSGFAAGTARTMAQYLAEADRLRHSPELIGTRDWGDQMALNLYCHSDPTRWLEVSDGWNYCVHDRARGEVGIRQGQLLSARHTPIHVVHGNAHSFRHLELRSF